MTASRLLVLVAVILFVLATFSVNVAGVALVLLGLAFFAASFLV